MQWVCVDVVSGAAEENGPGDSYSARGVEEGDSFEETCYVQPRKMLSCNP